MRVLIVEDNRNIAESIGEYLSLYDHSVEYAFNGKMALSILETEEFDVVIMDIMLPKVNGLECIEALRGVGNGVPVIVLSACDTVSDRITGLNQGADDYLIKPFAMDELYARLQALVVRGPRQDVGELCIGNLSIRLASGSASVDELPLKLNKLQFKLLKAIASKYPDMVSKASLEYLLWGDDPPDSDALRTHLYRLRGILANAPSAPKIETVHGQGVRLVL